MTQKKSLQFICRQLLLPSFLFRYILCWLLYLITNKSLYASSVYVSYSAILKSLFLTVLGLCCCKDFSLVLGSGDHSPVGVCGLLIVVAPLVAEQGLWGTRASAVTAWGFSIRGCQAPEHRLNTCGAGVQQLHSLWDLPESRMEPVSPAFAGSFFTTKPLGKP